MEEETETVLFIVNTIPDQVGRTRYQHASALCAEFDTTILCAGEVPDAIAADATEVRMFTDASIPSLFVLFPFWLLYWMIKIRAAAVVVSPHSLYVTVTAFGAWLTSAVHVVDFWDDLELPVSSYLTRDGLSNRLKSVYHRSLYVVAKRVLGHVDLVVLSIHPDLVDKYDLSSVTVLELTNGFEPALLDVDDHDSNERIRFVYVGHAKAMRGIDAVIEVVASSLPASRLDIVGPADEIVTNVSSRHDNVVLHGTRPHEEAMSIVASSDIGLCVLDTSVENYRYSFPIKMFEYAALGTAIVASDTVGVRSLLTPKESVYLVDDTSENELREAVRELAEDPDYRRMLGQNAQTEIQQYAWPKILEQYTVGIRAQIDASS